MLLHRFLLPAKKICCLKSMKVKKSHLVSNFSSSNSPSSFNNNVDLSSVSLFNIKKTIKLANIEFDDQFTNIKTKCPVCCLDDTKDDKDQSARSVYINKTTGDFRCPSCRYGGKWGLIEKFYTAKNPRTLNELKTYQSLFLNAKEIHQKSNDLDHDAICENFELITIKNVNLVYDHYSLHEKVPKTSLITLQGRFNLETKEILLPLVDVDGKTVGYKIISKSGTDEDYVFKERTIPEHNCSGLLMFPNSKSKNKDAKDSTKGIIVLNVLDLLALTQTKVNATFICLPHGLKFLPQECLPTLEKYQELILWFNYNTAGWDVARNFAKKLDEKRCLFVRPTQSHPTPYRALLQDIEIKSIITKAEPILHKAITTFSSLRQDVLSDLQNIDKVQGVKWKRYPLLNKYLKGHRKGELTILTGPTGCGKTTFMSDYSLDLAMQGVNTLWGSFEIRNTRLATTLLRQFAGKPLIEKNSVDQLIEFDDWADKFESLPIYFMTFHGEQAIKVVMEAIDHATYVHDVNHVIIDNVQFMMGMSDESKHIDRFWKQDAIIASFRTFATRKNCHVTLVIHPRKEKDADDLTTSSIFGGAKATQEADNVMIIQDKRLTSIRGKKYLQIAKNRYSGDLGIMPLDFDKQSLSYAQKRKPKEDEKPTTEQEVPEIINP